MLVRPQGAANVGAVARAMKNMGFDDLALVGTSRRRIASAATTAVRAGDILDRATRWGSIGDAVADCNLVVGTSGQGGAYRDSPETPEEISTDVLSVATTGKVAVVFGPEHHGLTREDLEHCARLTRIDTSSEYPSINLAQSVLVVCYELRRQAMAVSDSAPRLTGANAAELARLESKMKGALLDMGFLNPQNPDRIMFVLRRMIGRAVVRPIEARILLGLAHQMQWCADAAAAAKRAGLSIAGRRDASVDEDGASS